MVVTGVVVCVHERVEFDCHDPIVPRRVRAVCTLAEEAEIAATAQARDARRVMSEEESHTVAGGEVVYVVSKDSDGERGGEARNLAGILVPDGHWLSVRHTAYAVVQTLVPVIPCQLDHLGVQVCIAVEAEVCGVVATRLGEIEVEGK